jgi:DNA-binding winged helix-turn-helix (wHTH) protein
MRYSFDEFTLDSETRQLFRAGREVPLAPKAYGLLELLVRLRPRAVSRTRLRTALWPDAHVGETSVHVLVSQVRALLGDDAQSPRYLRTVRDFGYAFAGDAKTDETTAGRKAEAAVTRFWLETGQERFPLGEGPNILGREESAAVTLDAPGISRRHARIDVRAREATLADLASKNGTFVGGERLIGPRRLQEGDEIRLGLRCTLLFRTSARDPTETEEA